jgi:hypothetical protein
VVGLQILQITMNWETEPRFWKAESLACWGRPKKTTLGEALSKNWCHSS